MTVQTRSAVIGIIALLFIGIVAYAAFKVVDEILPEEVNFEQTGNLVKDSPGFKSGIWYLVYEAPGSAALSVELVFNGTSRCVIGSTVTSCDSASFIQGARVRVEGFEASGVVTVKKAMFVGEGGGGYDDLIKVTEPRPNAVVRSPLRVSGEARGTWYFEASFPVKLLDANGKVLAAVPAQAEGEWMTEEFVPFKATLTFVAPTTETGTLVLEKDNPSGLPENDDQIRIPITFAQNERTVKLYYYDAEKDKDGSGNIMCSRAGLVTVDRTIPVTVTPIQDAINLLLKGELSAAETARGVSTEYPLQGVTLLGANLKDGHLTLEFNDPQNKTGGGACRVGILWYQIEATAKQFPEVKSVSFIPEELFQP